MAPTEQDEPQVKPNGVSHVLGERELERPGCKQELRRAQPGGETGPVVAGIFAPCLRKIY